MDQPRRRLLKSIGGSQNEADEIVSILSKRPKDMYQSLKNQYGGDYADRWLAQNKQEKKAQEEKEQADIAALEEKVRIEREHNNAYAAQIQADLAKQNGTI